MKLYDFLCKLYTLAGSTFTGDFPWESFKNLTHLSLRKCDQYVKCVKSFQKCVILIQSKFFFQSNPAGSKFGGSIPSLIGEYKNLKVLNFAESELTGTIPGEIGNVTTLESIILGKWTLVSHEGVYCMAKKRKSY